VEEGRGEVEAFDGGGDSSTSSCESACTLLLVVLSAVRGRGGEEEEREVELRDRAMSELDGEGQIAQYSPCASCQVPTAVKD
jgi:hypothetical protein